MRPSSFATVSATAVEPIDGRVLRITASGVFSACAEVAGLRARARQQLAVLAQHDVQVLDQRPYLGRIVASDVIDLAFAQTGHGRRDAVAARGRPHLDHDAGDQPEREQRQRDRQRA